MRHRTARILLPILMLAACGLPPRRVPAHPIRLLIVERLADQSHAATITNPATLRRFVDAINGARAPSQNETRSCGAFGYAPGPPVYAITLIYASGRRVPVGWGPTCDVIDVGGRVYLDDGTFSALLARSLGTAP